MKTPSELHITNKERLNSFLMNVKEYRKVLGRIYEYLKTADPNKLLHIDDELEREEEVAWNNLFEIYKRNNFQEYGLKLERPFGKSIQYFKFNLKEKRVFVDHLDARINLIISDIKDILNSDARILNNFKEVNQNPIFKITFIQSGEQTNGNKIFNALYINDDSNHLLKLKRLTNKVLKLTTLANKKGLSRKRIPYDGNAMDYLNTNKKCILYNKGKYTLTKILENIGDGQMCLSKTVEVKIINNDSYLRRTNKI